MTGSHPEEDGALPSVATISPGYVNSKLAPLHGADVGATPTLGTNVSSYFMTYFHGTTTKNLKRVLPSSQHGRQAIYRHEADPKYAYAATKVEDAWDYAEKAHAVTIMRPSVRPPFPIPRVYEVTPINPQDVEEDPRYRGEISRETTQAMFDPSLASPW